jgi:ComF family protein
LIIPVPLHPDREKARGFNQAFVIARVLSKRVNLPVNEVSLIRTSHTERYRAGLDAKGRSDTVARAFEIVHRRLIAGEKILLVDDVLTTGATAAACSRVLKEAGAERVNVLTIARTAR